MPRKPRFNLPGIPQHVIQRGNNRCPCFFSEADYRYYLNALRAALEHNRCRAHAYVLMNNHVHLVLTPLEKHSVSHTMQDLGRKYVRYVNDRYGRSGTLWEGRYKASLVDSEVYLLTCMRYVELNPVRAGMVARPGDYPWSSFAANALGRHDPVISQHALYCALAAEPAQRRHAYRQLFDEPIDEPILGELRDALNRELVLGKEAFKKVLEAVAHRQIRRGADGRPRVEDMIGIYESGPDGPLY
ncbi:MAG: transposase [Gammaproteobacteria bacterium]